MRNSVEGSTCPLPAIVPVHREITARQRAKTHAPGQRFKKGGDMLRRRCRQHIAPVSKAVNDDLAACCDKALNNSVKVIGMGMHPAR